METQNGPDGLEAYHLKPATLTFYFPGRSATVQSDVQLVHKEIEKQVAQLKI
jgi:hypothetical protein